jgi:DNA-binding transcriptional regulator YdaS (Cro superfamily)
MVMIMNPKKEIPKPINKHIAKAIELLGSQVALANACGGRVKQGHITNWLRRDKTITLENALKIEKATSGRITQKEMRPDLFEKEVSS